MDGDLRRGDKPQFDPSFAYLEHANLDILADDDRFAGFSAENEHDGRYPFLAAPRKPVSPAVSYAAQPAQVRLPGDTPRVADEKPGVVSGKIAPHQPPLSPEERSLEPKLQTLQTSRADFSACADGFSMQNGKPERSAA